MTAKRIHDNLTPFSIFVAVFTGLSWYVPLTIKRCSMKFFCCGPRPTCHHLTTAVYNRLEWVKEFNTRINISFVLSLTVNRRFQSCGSWKRITADTRDW